MPQVNSIIHALKSNLKAHGLKYADVASALDLSEASVKRLLSGQNLSLARLEKVCQLMSLEISDLVQFMQERQPLLQQLTEEQEQQIASDIELLLVTICVLNRWTLEDICKVYTIAETDCIRKLALLDRLKIIELLPRNRIKLLIAANFAWRNNGPIQRFFQENIGREYFATRFNQEGEQLIVLNGMLSPRANAEFQRKLERLVREFDDLNDDDAQLPLAERPGVTVVLAMRLWQYGLFAPLVRRK